MIPFSSMSLKIRGTRTKWMKRTFPKKMAWLRSLILLRVGKFWLLFSGHKNSFKKDFSLTESMLDFCILWKIRIKINLGNLLAQTQKEIGGQNNFPVLTIIGKSKVKSSRRRTKTREMWVKMRVKRKKWNILRKKSIKK